MDIGKSFSFVFEDKDWVKKLGIGALVSLVPILNFAWTGYTIKLLRNVGDEQDEPLPDWSDFGDKFVKGLILIVAGLIYAIPMFILTFGPMIALLSAVFSTNGNMQDSLIGAFAGVSFLVLCVALIYGLALSFYFPAVYINFSRKETFGSCFEIGKIIDIIKETIGDYLTAWVIALIMGIGLVILASIAFTILALIPCIGWILNLLLSAFLMVWPMTVVAHLLGQVYANHYGYAAAAPAEALPVTPPVAPAEAPEETSTETPTDTTEESTEAAPETPAEPPTEAPEDTSPPEGAE
jgi:hypothetical protein